MRHSTIRAVNAVSIAVPMAATKLRKILSSHKTSPGTGVPAGSGWVLLVLDWLLRILGTGVNRCAPRQLHALVWPGEFERTPGLADPRSVTCPRATSLLGTLPEQATAQGPTPADGWSINGGDVERSCRQLCTLRIYFTRRRLRLYRLRYCFQRSEREKAMVYLSGRRYHR